MADIRYPWEVKQPNAGWIDLRLWQSGDGRRDLSAGGYAPAPGDTVMAAFTKGTVVSVGDDVATIQWSDVDFPVRYPFDLPSNIRKALPWE